MYEKLGTEVPYIIQRINCLQMLDRPSSAPWVEKLTNNTRRQSASRTKTSWWATTDRTASAEQSTLFQHLQTDPTSDHHTFPLNTYCQVLIKYVHVWQICLKWWVRLREAVKHAFRLNLPNWNGRRIQTRRPEDKNIGVARLFWERNLKCRRKTVDWKTFKPPITKIRLQWRKALALKFKTKIENDAANWPQVTWNDANLPLTYAVYNRLSICAITIFSNVTRWVWWP